METFRLSRAWSATRTASDWPTGGESSFVSRRRSLLQIATKNCRSGGSCCCSLARDRKDYGGGCVDLVRARFGGVHEFLSQQERHLQRPEWRCGSNEESNSPSVTVVSDDEIEIHRKELLALYWDDRLEERIGGERDGREDVEEDVEEDENKNAEYEDEEFTRLRAAATSSLYTSLEQVEEENYQPQKAHWWMSLTVNVRRMLTPRTRGILLLNILTFLYGSNISIIKRAGETMDPTLFSVGRFAIASLAFTPFLSHAFKDKKLRKASVELGLLASSGYLTQCISVLTSDAARVSFISTFTVIVVPLLAGLSGAKISKITWVAAVTALLGVGILESNGAPLAIGDLLSFVSAVMFGVHMIRTEHHSKTLSIEDSLPVMALQLVVITMCSGVWFCASHTDSGYLVSNLPASNWPSVWEKTVSIPWLSMLYTGLLSTAFCLWSELVSMRDVKATEAAVIYTTEPLWGAAFAWLTLGERWGPNGWLGASFILGGSLTMQLFGRPDSTPKRIAVSQSNLDILDTVFSPVERESLSQRVEGRNVSIKLLHRQRLRERKLARATRKRRKDRQH